MKTAISMPDELFEKTEAEAHNLGLSRSKVIQVALEQYFAARREAAFTESINRAVERDGGLSAEDEIWLEHGRRVIFEALKDDEWEQ